MKVRVVYKPDKTVAVIYPAPNSRRVGEPEADWLGRVFAKAMESGFNGLPFDDIDTAELPQTREDREAWEGEKGKGVSVNLVKAQQLRDEVQKEEKIAEKLREMAIKELEKDGEI